MSHEPNYFFLGSKTVLAGIGIITNPHSKLNKRNPERTDLLSYILGEKGVIETTNSLADLARVAQQFRDRNISILAINGGDGTISRTLSAFIKEYGEKPLPDIALLRGGTMNVVASNLGVRGTPESILYRLVEAVSSHEDLPRMKLWTMKVEENFGFLFGTGIASSFLKLYYKNKSNALGAVLLICRIYFAYFFDQAFFSKHIREYSYSFRSNNTSVAAKSVALLCATVQRMPMGFKLFRAAWKKERHMQCVNFGIHPREIAWKLPFALLRNGEGTSFGKTSWLADHLTIDSQEPIDYTVDGELFAAKSRSLVVEMGPQLNFILL